MSQNGHQEIVLPWKSYTPNLPVNRIQAERRLEPLKKRLKVVIPLIKVIFRTFFKNLEKCISDTLNIVVSEFILEMT